MGDTRRTINNAVGSATSSAAANVAAGVNAAPGFLSNLVNEASTIEHELLGSIGMNGFLSIATAVAAVAMIGYYYGVIITIIIVLFILSFLFMKAQVSDNLKLAGGTIATAALDAISSTAAITTHAVGKAIQ